MKSDSGIQHGLTQEELELLARGLEEWGGPAHPTDAVARAIGFDSIDALYEQGEQLAQQVRSGEAVSAADWRRALLATEIVFASDVVGSGWDWSTTMGYSDEETIELLRSIQYKLVRVVREQ